MDSCWRGARPTQILRRLFHRPGPEFAGAPTRCARKLRPPPGDWNFRVSWPSAARGRPAMHENGGFCGSLGPGNSYFLSRRLFEARGLEGRSSAFAPPGRLSLINMTYIICIYLSLARTGSDGKWKWRRKPLKQWIPRLEMAPRFWRLAEAVADQRSGLSGRDRASSWREPHSAHEPS